MKPSRGTILIRLCLTKSSWAHLIPDTLPIFKLQPEAPKHISFQPDSKLNHGLPLVSTYADSHTDILEHHWKFTLNRIQRNLFWKLIGKTSAIKKLKLFLFHGLRSVCLWTKVLTSVIYSAFSKQCTFMTSAAYITQFNFHLFSSIHVYIQ